MPNPTDRSATKEERIEYRRFYYLAFPEKRREQEKAKVAKKPELYRNIVKRWGIENADYVRDQSRQYYLDHRDEIRARVAAYEAGLSVEERRARHRKYDAKRRLKPHYKILQSLRGRIYHILRGWNRSKSTMALLGCSIEEFKAHLQSQFKPGMTWGNYGQGWHIDHIMPCSVFDLTNPAHQRQCFHFSNMRPLWAAENRARGNKIFYKIAA